MRIAVLGALGASVLLGGWQAAPDAPLSLMLTCNGTDTETQQTGVATSVTVRPGVDPGIGPPEHRAAHIAATQRTETTAKPVMGLVRVPAHMSIRIEGGRIAVRPSDQSAPGWGQKKSPDGWYELTNVEITDAQFRGRASYGALLSGKHRLVVDRTTGDVRYGGFSGVCEKSATGPTETKF